MKGWLSKIFLLFSVFFAIQSMQSAMAAEDPNVLTEKIAHNLFKDIQAHKAEIQSNPNILKSIVRKDLMPYANTRVILIATLGSDFRTLTDEQKEKAFSAFDKYVEAMYAHLVAVYVDSADLQVQTRKLSGDRFESVGVHLTHEKAKNFYFYWRKNPKTNQWFIYDLGLDGAKLLALLSPDNSVVLRTQGFDAFIAKLSRISEQNVNPKAYLVLYNNTKQK
ncbi:MlaC/ttg2D family ABC transporter substrate-binding protein [Lonepinella sp. BR2271]|uniref:MlaC/ttg2D family ABC transporter substrate-binding protein n=1 Tax=Lonepinella sp. BR2271 TaxID=3434550 RepID=UPI003F6E0BDB